MDRDERWEKVWASVGAYVWPYEDETVVPSDPATEFLIEVEYLGTVWYNRILVSDEDLKAFSEIYQKTLDEMVKGVDDYIKRIEQARQMRDIYVFNGTSVNRVGEYSQDDAWVQEAAERNPYHIYFYGEE